MSRLRLPALALWVFLFWTALGLFFATQIILLGPPEVTWRLALVYSMPRWYVWGLLTPGIVIVDRWVGAGRTLRARLLLHLPLGLAWTALAIAIRLFVRPLVGNTWPPSIARFFLERVYWDLLIYAVIAGVAVARDYARQLREQEQQAHQLQLEAVELQRHLAEARLQSLRSQLQPHFLFNALNTMSSLTESDPKTARRLMEQLGQLPRISLRHASTPLVTLAEELTFLDDYLAIESVRFEGRITCPCRPTMTRSMPWCRASCCSRSSRTPFDTASVHVCPAGASESRWCGTARCCAYACATMGLGWRRIGRRDRMSASDCGTRRPGWSTCIRALIAQQPAHAEPEGQVGSEGLDEMTPADLGWHVRIGEEELQAPDSRKQRHRESGLGGAAPEPSNQRHEKEGPENPAAEL
jgi:hypothetical protein